MLTGTRTNNLLMPQRVAHASGHPFSSSEQRGVLWGPKMDRGLNVVGPHGVVVARVPENWDLARDVIRVMTEV